MTITQLYDELSACYGNLDKWWPARDPYEVMVGAILTQNTAWTNVRQALENFEGDLSPQRILDLPLEELKLLIKPAGFFNQKAVYLKELTTWFAKYDFDVQQVARIPLDELRQELLAVKGVGPETADSILLYAFGLPSFVIDAYTMRICGRIPVEIGSNYKSAKKAFENSLPLDATLFNHYHALIVTHAKRHCLKKPNCSGCPVRKHCVSASI